MLEGKFTQKLLKALRSAPELHEAVIWKHSDWITAGVPDFSVTINGLTTWFEVKVAPNVPTKLQAYYLEKLQPRAYLVTVSKFGTVMIHDVATRDMEDAVNLIVELSLEEI